MDLLMETGMSVTSLPSYARTKNYDYNKYLSWSSEIVFTILLIHIRCNGQLANC